MDLRRFAFKIFPGFFLLNATHIQSAAIAGSYPVLFTLLKPLIRLLLRATRYLLCEAYIRL